MIRQPGSAAPIPIPRELTLLLSAAVARHPSQWLVPRSITGGDRPCSPSTVLLIASGADIKTVQPRMRRATAATTLDVYGHLWPDADESTRAAVGATIAARGTPADALRTLRPEAVGNRRSGGLAGV